MLNGASARLPQFLANDSSDHFCTDLFARPAHVLAQCLIDHRLVTATFGVCPFPKRLENAVVKMNRDLGLVPLANHRTAATPD